MIRKIIPADQLDNIIDNLGIPYSGINTSYNNTGTMSPADGDILVSLKPNHAPTNKYVREIRKEMSQQFPGVTLWFPAADIVAQILNFGLSAPIDVQLIGTDRDQTHAFAEKILEQIRKVPGAVDFHIQEPNNAPRLDVTVNRAKASSLGLTQLDVANSTLGALAGSQQTSPNFWVDPKNSISYTFNAQSPQYSLESFDALMNLPILGSSLGTTQILANVASLSRSQTSPVMDRYNLRPVINIYGFVDGKDLNSVAQKIQKIIEANRQDLPRGSTMKLHHRASCRSGWHRLDSFHHRDNSERSRPHGSNHVHGGGHRQQRARCNLCR